MYGAMKATKNPTGGKMKPVVKQLISPVGRGLSSPDIAAGRSKGRKLGGR